MFEVARLNFSYPLRDTLFQELSFSFGEHENILLQGENGSGKSTLLALLCGKLEPESGQIQRSETRPCFYLPQEADKRILGINLAQDLKLWQMAGLDPDRLRRHPLLKSFADDFWEMPLKTLSQGSKQAYLLALALSHTQSYLVLDEPYPALDKERRELLTRELAKRQGLLLVSHLRPELHFDRELSIKGGMLS